MQGAPPVLPDPDAQAIERCRAGEVDAFADVVERHQAAVYGTPLRPWLLRIATNEALNHLRREGREARQTLAGEAGRTALESLVAERADPAAGALAREQREAVQRALDALPPAYRAVAVLRYLHDLSYAEIADQTGLPTNTVGVYLLRARDQMRKALAAEGVSAHDLS